MITKASFCLYFTANTSGTLFAARNGETPVMQCDYTDGTLDFWLLYDFKPDAPLHLTGKATQGDTICINLSPHRIELYVNDILLDEEWPCGKLLITEQTQLEDRCCLRIGEPIAEKDRQPDTLAVFQNASGWKPEENVFVGDCMPYVHNGRYHVLYLKDRHHHTSKWGLGAHQWNHISTNDFVNWDIHPMAVPIDRAWEGSICTGSWICDGAKHYLFYTVRMCDGSPAKICRSISVDGTHFEKDRAFSFTLSDRYIASSARDPKVVKDESGVYHMILTTSTASPQRGCLAHLTSADLNVWQDTGEPIFVSDTDLSEPECPDHFYKDGYYYLVYSLHGKGYYQYSKEPFSGWQKPKDPIIPCKSVPKAGVWHDRLIFTGFDGNGRYAGTMTFLEAFVQENGELAYKAFDELTV